MQGKTRLFHAGSRIKLEPLAFKRAFLIALRGLLWLPLSLQTICAEVRIEPMSKVTIFINQQDTIKQLAPTEAVTGEIKGGEVRLFSITLAVNQYARLVVQRHGIDLTVNIFPPQNPVPIKFENPAGAESPILPLVKAEVSGIYTIEIRPKNKWLAQGRYEIQLQELPVPSLIDEKRFLAQQKVAEGRRQQRLETQESNRAALVIYEHALTLWQEVEDRFEEANALQLIAQTHKALRDLEKANTYYNLALEKRGDDRQAKSYTMLDRADAQYTLKSPRASLPLYEETLLAFRENQNRLGEALVLGQIGLVYMQLFDWVAARNTLEQALLLNRSINDTHGEMRVINALGGVFDNQGQPEKALEFYKQARDGFLRLGDLARAGNIDNNIALHYDTWGEWREAVESYNQALKLLLAGHAAGDVDRTYLNSKNASVFYNLGSLYISLGNYEKGLDYLQQSLDLRPPKAQAGTLTWFAYAYILLGDAKKALEYCDRAIKLQEEAGDPRRAQTYTVMGTAHDILGSHQKAVEYFNKALEIQQSAQTLDLKGQAITLDKRGGALAAIGRLVEARKDLSDALLLWRTFKDRNGEALSLYQLARIERDSGNFSLGMTLAEAAIKIIEPLRNNVVGQQMRASYFATKVDYYELYIDLTMLARTNDNDAERTAAAFEASERERARVMLDTLSDANLDSGMLMDPSLSKLVEKRRLLQRSLLIKSSQRSQALLKNSEKEITSLDQGIANLELELMGVEKQLSMQYPEYATLTSSEPLRASELQKQLDGDTLLLEIALGEKRSYAWVVSPNSIHGVELSPREKIEAVARKLGEALMARNQRSENETPIESKQRIDQADTEFAEASARLSKMVLEPVASLLGRKRLVVVADGALQLIPFAALPIPTGSSVSENVSSSIPNPTATAVGPRPLISEYEVITLPSASVLALHRRELASRKPAPYTAAIMADPVYQQTDIRLVAASKLRKKGNEIVKNGQGGPVPKQIVPNASTTANSLTTKANSSTTTPNPSGPTPSSPAMASINETSRLATALRDVGIDGSLTRLPWSAREARTIAELIPRNQLFSAVGFKANRETATSAMLSKYRFIHFATHGIMDLDHPELSGIVFSMFDEKGQPQDGYLRLHEIYNLNLPAELVVLSACQTGVGKQIKGEGLIALTRGFMYAGAKSIVASLWKVDDAATAELMEEFYKQMFTNKLKPAAALRAAQIKMSQKKHRNSPYYWAGFFLQGEWN